MKIDVLRFLAMPDQSLKMGYSRQSHSLGNLVDVITPIDASGFGQWKHVKNIQGWPWDLKLYDEGYVYDWIKEGPNSRDKNINIGPRSFKKFIGNHESLGNKITDGLAMFPRYVDTVETKSEMPYGSNQTRYDTFENCIQVGSSSLGSVRHILYGPYMLYHGGDVGMQPTLIHKYYWNNNSVQTLEENYYVLNWGWVAWKLMELDKNTGFYKLVDETLDINLMRVQEVKVIFSLDSP